MIWKVWQSWTLALGHGIQSTHQYFITPKLELILFFLDNKAVQFEWLHGSLQLATEAWKLPKDKDWALLYCLIKHHIDICQS